MRVRVTLRAFAIVLLLAWSAIVFGQNREAADFVVSPDGNDQNRGTVESPFATLARAQQAVRELKQAGPARDMTVLVRGGTYFLTASLVFGPKDSAAEGKRITYAAWPGETPVISGGRALSAWQPGEANRWTMKIDEVAAGKWSFDQLFIEGGRRPRARHPNQGFLHVEAAGPDNRTSFQFRPGDFPEGVSLSGAEVVFLHDWSISRVPIRQFGPKANHLVLAHPIGAPADFFRICGFEPHPRYFVENALELLDTPGEWYLDKEQGVLSYQAAPGEDLARTTTVARRLDQLLMVRGDEKTQQPVANLRFVGLHFAHAAAPRFPSGYAGIQAGFHEQRSGASAAPWNGRMPAAVIFQLAQGCSLEKCRIEHVGGTAFSLEGRSTNNRIVGNEIADAGGNGVMVGEPGMQPQDLAVNNEVIQNDIHQCGRLYYGCVGVWVGITQGTVVAQNEIHDLPYSGVSVGWQWSPAATPCRDNRIENNHIHHVMQVLSDGGGIYTLGRQPGTVLRGNLVHDIPLNAGRAESNGFFIDEGSSDLLIENNIIYGIERSPIRFHQALGDMVRNNILVTAAEVPAFRFNATDEKSITFEANQTPKPEEWSPPLPAAVGAGCSANEK